jgi:quinol monooxygenase YgiN
MNQTKVIITFEAKPQAASRFRAMLEQAGQELPKVSGCKGVRIFSADGNPCIFTLVEDWESQDAHKAHIGKVVASGGWATLAACLAKDPVSHYYNELELR